MELQLCETSQSLGKSHCFIVTGASVFKRIMEEWEEK